MFYSMAVAFQTCSTGELKLGRRSVGARPQTSCLLFYARVVNGIGRYAKLNTVASNPRYFVCLRL